MLKANRNLSNAMQMFNLFTAARAEIVLTRIFLKPGANFKDLFSSDELAKFNKSMQLTPENIQQIVNAFSFILMYIVAERNLKIVEAVLLECGLQSDLYKILQNLWLQYGNDYSTKIREQPVAVRDYLHSFNWNMTLQIEESRLPLKTAANLMNVEGKIDNCDDLFSYDARNPTITYIFETQQDQDTKYEKFSIKFQKNDVQGLFEQLEIIQDSLDLLV